MEAKVSVPELVLQRRQLAAQHQAAFPLRYDAAGVLPAVLQEKVATDGLTHLLCHARSQRQPGALLPGAEVHHDVGSQPHGEAQRRAPGQLHRDLHLEHLGAVQAAESPRLRV